MGRMRRRVEWAAGTRGVVSDVGTSSAVPSRDNFDRLSRNPSPPDRSLHIEMT